MVGTKLGTAPVGVEVPADHPLSSLSDSITADKCQILIRAVVEIHRNRNVLSGAHAVRDLLDSKALQSLLPIPNSVSAKMTFFTF